MSTMAQFTYWSNRLFGALSVGSVGSKKPNFVNSIQINGVALESLLGDDTLTTGITAFATGGQASATALTTNFNNVTVCATAGDSVKLLAAAAGEVQTIKNSGAAALDVFPATGDSINALAVNLAVRIAPNSMVTFRAIDATVWETMEVLSLPAPTTLRGAFNFKAADNAANYQVDIVNASHGQATVHTVPDGGSASDSFVMTAGAQTIAGVKTFSSAPVLSGASIALGSIPRSAMEETSLAKFRVPLEFFTSLSAGGAFNGFALEGGTGAPVIKTADVDNATSTELAIFTIQVPENYTATEDIKFSVYSKYIITGDAVAGANNDIDLAVQVIDQTAGTVGADLYAGAALAISASYAEKLFVITPTGVTAGSLLKVTVTVRTHDSDAGAGTIATYLLAPHFQFDVKG